MKHPAPPPASTRSLAPWMLPVAMVGLVLCVAIPAEGQPFGIDTRAENTTLLLDELPPAAPGTMQLERVFDQLTFQNPILLVEAPDNSDRLFVLERGGRIKTFPHIPDPTPAQVTTFYDVSGRIFTAVEQGLLGFAFDPDYGTNGEFYIYYSYNDGSSSSPGPSRISRITNGNPAGDTVVGGTEEVILEVPQPYENHNGGMIAFGPDNMLYISLGDGGSGGDPLNSGQDTTTLLGNILRLDVRSTPDPGLNYAIPPDNPFVSGGPAGSSTRKEIFAYGLRNMWRFSFDAVNGLLYGGDVGQGSYEEIDVVTSGGNYGWKIREGMHCYNAVSCATAGLIDPIAEYGRTQGRSVTGGYVYYGADSPELYGQYVYGDFATGRIWALNYDGSQVTSGPTVIVNAAGFNIAGFGQDDDGEVYVLRFSSSGGVYVLRPQTAGGGTTFPLALSDLPALLAAGSGIDQTTEGIIPYEPSSKLWSDGAFKERYIALPHLDQMGYQPYRGWDFPENSVIVKNFLLPQDFRDPVNTLKRIETRILFKKNSQWHGFTFEWDDAETDAQLLASSRDRDFTLIDEDGQPFDYTWHYPSRNECLQCHTNAANGVLGLNTPQMNYDFTYPASGVTDNQLRTFDHIALFDAPLPATPANLPRMPDSTDTSEPLQDRARAYLAANCSMCHQVGGTAPTSLDLRWEITNAQMDAIEVDPLNGDLGITNAKIIAEGDPARSVLLQRMDVRGNNQMPPLATSLVDEEAVDLINEWILSLGLSDTPHWTFY